MKKFMGKIRNLSQKAAEIQAAIERVPPKIAQMRETVAMTSGQLRQLRTDVQAGIADLRTDNETGMLEALKELNRAAAIFQEAGYEMAAIDMELNPNQRWIVHLWKAAEVHSAQLAALIRANQNSRTIHGVLTSIASAEEMARQVAIDGFTYQKLIVHIGLVPSVRMCWIADEEEVQTASAVSVAPASVATQPVKSAFEQTSFFVRRPAEPVAVSSSSSPVAGPEGQPTGGAALTTPASELAEQKYAAMATSRGSDWKQDALERFKKMPDLSKYRRGT